MRGLVKAWQRTQLAGYINKYLQIMRLCSERRLAPMDSWIGQSGLRSLDVLIDGRHGRHMMKQRTRSAGSRREVVDIAFQVVGAASVSKRHELERLYRDVRTGPLHPPNSDAVLEAIGAAALGLGPGQPAVGR